MSFPSLEVDPAHDTPHVKAEASKPKAFETGWDYVDKGPACERSPSVGTCVLDPKVRSRLEEEIDRVGAGSLTNYHAALQNARLALLMKKDGGPGYLGDLMIGVLSSALLGGLGVLVGRFARTLAATAVWSGETASHAFDAAVRGHQSLFMSGVRQLVGAARVPLKQALVGYSSETLEQINVVTELQSSATTVVEGIISKAKVGDDVTLIWARAALDPDRLTVSLFAHFIEDLLARFAASHLDQLGTTKTGPVEDGDRHVVRFVNGSASRLAVIDVRDRKKLATSHGDDWFTSGGTTFVNWVDQDLAEVAETAQGRHGTGQISTIDLATDTSWDGIKPIWTWKFGGAQ